MNTKILEWPPAAMLRIMCPSWFLARVAQWAWIVIGAVVMSALSAGQAQAGGLMFGTDEQIRKIQPTKDLKYTLCHKVRTYFFIAGCYVKDDGYVLQKAGDSEKYMSLTPALIELLQQEGELPTPLPGYSLSFVDYLFGYSNWIILALLIGIPIGKAAWDKAWARRADTIQPSQPNPQMALSEELPPG